VPNTGQHLKSTTRHSLVSGVPVDDRNDPVLLTPNQQAVHEQVVRTGVVADLIARDATIRSEASVTAAVIEDSRRFGGATMCVVG
jgi:hypothetical protein